MTLQPNQHFNQNIDVNTVRFDRASTGERVYSVDIVNLKTTYQFDKHFLVRLLEQFDSSSHRLLTDLLASYEFVPGTVFHAGYGSLYEKRAVQAGRTRAVQRRRKLLDGQSRALLQGVLPAPLLDLRSPDTLLNRSALG